MSFVTNLPPDCSRDLSELKSTYYKDLDQSQLEQALHSLSAQVSEKNLIGEGSDCRSYRMPGDCVALTIPKPEFWRRITPEKWEKLLRTLQSLPPTPLIPPLTVVRANGQIGVALPYGTESAHHAAAHWQPVSEWAASTEAILRDHGLVIEDWLQIKTRRGIPFIIDFSDLRESR